MHRWISFRLILLHIYGISDMTAREACSTYWARLWNQIRRSGRLFAAFEQSAGGKVAEAARHFLGSAFTRRLVHNREPHFRFVGTNQERVCSQRWQCEGSTGYRHCDERNRRSNPCSFVARWDCFTLLAMSTQGRQHFIWSKLLHTEITCSNSLTLAVSTCIWCAKRMASP